MCLAIPVRVDELLPDGMARISLAGVTREICVSLVDDVSVGDYVVLHVGFAIARISPAEAEKTLALINDFTGCSP
jgi:hydrogenase expression/formation protein HypC